MTEPASGTGANLRLARQVRGFSQQQLASMAGVSRQAVSAVESGHSDPSLRVALALAQALGMSVEDLFGPGEPAAPVAAISLAPLHDGNGRDGNSRHDGHEGPSRVMLAPVGDRFIALPLRGDSGAGLGFLSAGGLAVPLAAGPANGAVTSIGTGPADAGPERISVRPIGPPRPTLVVAGCDPALPLLATPLALLDPPVAFAWWPCGSGAALRLAQQGLVHVAGVHTQGDRESSGQALPDGATQVGFTAWREGLVLRPGLWPAVDSVAAIAKRKLRIVNREPGAEARRLLDAELRRSGISPEEIVGYETKAAGHLQVAAAINAGLADAGVASEPAARAYGLAFAPLAEERFSLVIPAEHAASREVQALLKVLASPWLLAQLASLPGYDATTCGERAS
jgi:molybdate-binding protein/transcriptional regulator with XRE-family HTH domain